MLGNEVFVYSGGMLAGICPVFELSDKLGTYYSSVHHDIAGFLDK